MWDGTTAQCLFGTLGCAGIDEADQRRGGIHFPVCHFSREAIVELLSVLGNKLLFQSWISLNSVSAHQALFAEAHSWLFPVQVLVSIS